ncbi:MAG TPA: helix-turn-helix domain-containing protein [Thermotogota bacterium]|nr:helix-turn-helix domain-containing protein [Thermotogota bacterium]
MNLIENLKIIGFSEYEAKIYLALLQYGELTGYSASKKSNIPKPNAYSALNGLVKKNAALKTEGKNTTFSAVDFETIERVYRRKTDQILSDIKNNLPERKPSAKKFFNLEEKENLIARIRTLIENAGRSIILDIHQSDYESVAHSMAIALNKKVKVFLILNNGEKLTNEKAFEYLCYHPETHSRDMSMVVDGESAINCNLSDDVASGVFSQNSSFIGVILEALTHDIYLHEAVKKIDGETRKELLKIQEKMEVLENEF